MTLCTCDSQSTSVHLPALHQLVALALHILFPPRLECTFSSCFPHLPFISTLIKHAFNKPLQILTASLNLRIADSFCIRFKEQPFPTQPHVAASTQGQLIAQLNYSTFLDLCKGILSCWYPLRELRRKVLLASNFNCISIDIVLHSFLLFYSTSYLASDAGKPSPLSWLSSLSSAGKSWIPPPSHPHHPQAKQNQPLSFLP